MSVINKMLRDLDSGQTPGATPQPSQYSGLGAIRDTVSIEDDNKSDRYVYPARIKPFVLVTLMVMAAVVALWYLMGFSNVGKPTAWMLPSSPAVLEKPAEPVSAVVMPKVVMPKSAPVAAPAMQEAPPVQTQTALPEPTAAANAMNFARMLAEPPLPRPLPAPAKPQAVQGSASVLLRAPAAKAAPATSMPGSATPEVPSGAAPTLPKASVPTQARTPIEQPVSPDAPAQAQKQAAIQETLAQAQNLWNSGSKEAAMELLREAVTVAERAKSNGALPLDSPALPSLLRELTRMELAEGRASQVLDMLIRLEPLVPNQADLWAVRGNAAQRLGQHQQASNAYLAALKLRPNEPRWMLGAAVSLAAQGQMVAAAALTDKARMTGTVSPEVLSYMRQLGVPIR